MTLMHQCLLEQDNCQTVGWIEDRGAKINARVEVPELKGFWKVVEIYGQMDKAILNEKQVRDRDCLPSLQKV